MHAVHITRNIIMVFVMCLCALSLRAELKTIEVQCFRGGYGINAYERAAREFEKLHPDVKIDVHGDPHVWVQLLPRFAAGTPPDLCLPGFGMNVFALIFEGQLLPLDTYLDQPALGSARKWRDTFLPNMLKKGMWKGSYYTIPYNFDTFGWWYNKKLFRDHGWKPPKNYDELLAVCAEIRRTTDIAPVTLTGRYPEYMLTGFFFPWAFSAGGPKVLADADNLTTGAWKHPAFLRAAKALMELKHRGYIQAGAIGMNHTESQMEFLVGRAAMIPNGTWLYSEMKELLPPGFEMEFFVTPPFPDGVGDPTAVQSSYDGKGWCIPTKGKHPEVAAEFLRYLTSAQVAQRFMQDKATMMSVTGLDESKIPATLREASRAVREAKSNWTIYYAQWYPELGATVVNAIKQLYNEVLTPEEFLDSIEAKAAQMRANPKLQRFAGK